MNANDPNDGRFRQASRATRARAAFDAEGRADQIQTIGIVLAVICGLGAVSSLLFGGPPFWLCVIAGLVFWVLCYGLAGIIRATAPR